MSGVGLCLSPYPRAVSTPAEICSLLAWGEDSLSLSQEEGVKPRAPDAPLLGLKPGVALPFCSYSRNVKWEESLENCKLSIGDTLLRRMSFYLIA